MSWLDALRHRVRTALFPGAHARELAEEMRHHLELDTMQQRDAWAARRRFGNETRWAEATRERTLIRWLDLLAQDARHAWRSLRRDPGVTVAVVVTLALGVGVNAATFALLDRLYLRAPGGVEDPASVRRLFVRHFNTEDGVPFAAPQISMPQYDALRAVAPDPSRFALFVTDWALRQGPRLDAPRLRAVMATASYWDVLGVRPALGRLYTAEEDRPGAAATVAVVSDHFWRTRLGGTTAALGATLPIGTRTFTVIGVLPERFTGLDLQAADVWIPLYARAAASWEGARWWEAHHMISYQPLLRVRPGDPLARFEARAQLGVRRTNTAWHPQHPDSLSEVVLGPLVGLGPQKPGQEMIIASRLAAVAAVVLAIAVANVINLLLARAMRRRREVAVRLALGVSRRRLVRLLLAEALLLAAFAAVAALLVGGWWGDTLRALLLEGVEWREPVLGARVAAFTLLVALGAGLLAGLVPALQSSRQDLGLALKSGAREGGGRRSRLRAALVATQAALSVVLLVGAMLFVRSLENVRGLDIGYDADRLLFGDVAFDEGREVAPPRVGERLAEVAARLRARPGIEETALAAITPMRGWSILRAFADRDTIPARLTPTMHAVTPSFFRAAGVRLLAGAPLDGRTRQAVVNRAMAERVWPGQDPLGRCLRLQSREGPCYTVVGVAENVHRDNVIENEAHAQYYLPLAVMPESGWTAGTIVVRASDAPGAAAAATAELQSALRRAFPGAQATVTPMTDNLEPEYRPWVLGARLFTWMGLLALAVAVVGMYGTVSYGVTQRAHEFGVRAALGARAGHIVGHVLAGGVRTAGAGVLAGVLLALASGRFVRALLYGVSPTDPVTLALVAGVLLVVALLAALVPAWRASRADPMAALRAD